jgi:glucose-6-phosphate dehydrogenase assembly protein OpcA
VTIEAGGIIVETAASAIAPLLVPDVPVFLWWKDIPHYDDPLFNRLSRLADRVVIDSAAFDHPHEDMLRLRGVVAEIAPGARVSDLNWGRLTSWRTLLASFWDVAEYRSALADIESVTIEYDAPDAAPGEIAPQALLVAGWLASRLGWQVAPDSGARKEGNTTTFKLAAPAHPLVIEMRAMEDEKGGDGMLASLTLHAASRGVSFSVALSRDGKRLETKACMNEAHVIGRVLAYEQKTEGQRLSREFGLLARDLVYEQTLAIAAQLIEAAARS